MTSSMASEALRHDLELKRELVHYQSKDKELADAAIKAFKAHQWYHKQERIPLCLFDAKLPEEEKKVIARKIICEKNAVNFAIISISFFNMLRNYTLHQLFYK